MLTILDAGDLLGVPGTVGPKSQESRRKDIEQLYWQSSFGRGAGRKVFRRSRPTGGALAYVDGCLALKWAEAGLSTKVGVISQREFNELSHAYASWSIHSAAATLVKMRSTPVSERVQIVPLNQSDFM